MLDSEGAEDEGAYCEGTERSLAIGWPNCEEGIGEEGAFGKDAVPFSEDERR